MKLVIVKRTNFKPIIFNTFYPPDIQKVLFCCKRYNTSFQLFLVSKICPIWFEARSCSFEDLSSNHLSMIQQKHRMTIIARRQWTLLIHRYSPTHGVRRLLFCWCNSCMFCRQPVWPLQLGLIRFLSKLLWWNIVHLPSN